MSSSIVHYYLQIPGLKYSMYLYFILFVLNFGMPNNWQYFLFICSLISDQLNFSYSNNLEMSVSTSRGHFMSCYFSR